MASNNRLWGAERMRGELLKLDSHICKRTVQKYRRPIHTARPRGQKWSTFLHAHAEQIWACDAPARRLPSSSARFSPSSLSNCASRNVIHVGVTRCPTDAWTARTDSGSDRLWRGAARISSVIILVTVYNGLMR